MDQKIEYEFNFLPGGGSPVDEKVHTFKNSLDSVPDTPTLHRRGKVWFLSRLQR